MAMAELCSFERVELQAAQMERRRLARDLHDCVSPYVYAIALTAASVERLWSSDRERAEVQIVELDALVHSALAEMRVLLDVLRPTELEREGVAAALRKRISRFSTHSHVVLHATLAPEPAVPLDTKEAIYRVGLEALHNAAKHAGPSTVEVRLEQQRDALLLEVSDDGQGFDSQRQWPGHFGLSFMRERMTGVGGWLDIESAEGAGTRIFARVPLSGTGAAVTDPERGRSSGWHAASDSAVLEQRQRLAARLDSSVALWLGGIALNVRAAGIRTEMPMAAREIHALAQTILAELRSIIVELRLESTTPPGQSARGE
jgi:signal transduction histidine kinase